MRTPTFTSNELATLVAFAAMAKPEDVTGQDADTIRAVIYKAKSIAQRKGDTVYVRKFHITA